MLYIVKKRSLKTVSNALVVNAVCLNRSKMAASEPELKLIHICLSLCLQADISMAARNKMLTTISVFPGYSSSKGLVIILYDKTRSAKSSMEKLDLAELKLHNHPKKRA